MSTLAILVILLFIIIIIFQPLLSKPLYMILISFSLLLFAPILPMTEAVFNISKNRFSENYGKIRLSGSLSFLFTVLLIGIFIEQYSLDIYPVLFLAASFILLINIIFMENQDSSINVLSYKNNIKSLILQKEYLIVLTVCSLIQSSHAMYYSFSTILWSNIGLSVNNIGKLWGIAIIAEILLFYKISKLKVKNNFYLFLSLSAFLSSIRWLATYVTSDFYLLILIQLLHAISFGLTHYLMMYYINSKVSKELKLLAQIAYHGLSGGIMLTFFILCLAFYFSYFNDNKGYLLMVIICVFSFIISYLARK